MTDALWTPDELIAAAHAVPDGPISAPITGFSIDTRSLQPGEVFVALKDARDGHEFVSNAFAAGAGAALVHAGYRRRPGDGALLRVDDPLRALERIAAAARARLPPAARVIAVTGSAGKTGTKEMLRACLARFGPTHAPEKSFNNHWGVPLTLARMPAATRFAVIEMGMNHPGEIRPLTRLARPHIAIVANVLPVHVGNFADGEAGVAHAKAEIFEGLEPGGTAILPRDNAYFPVLERAARTRNLQVRTFGRDSLADAWPLDGGGRQSGSAALPKEVVAARVRSGDSFVDVAYEIGTPGGHIVTNSLAVLLTLESIGQLASVALEPLTTVKPQQGRGRRTYFPSANALMIDESYNANPRSMHAAITVLGAVLAGQPQRRIAVLGDMLELGERAADFHLGLKGSIEQAKIDLVFACGPNMKLLYDSLPAALQAHWTPTSEGLIEPLLACLGAGDVVMIKGSLGSRMAPIVDALKRRYAAS